MANSPFMGIRRLHCLLFASILQGASIAYPQQEDSDYTLDDVLQRYVDSMGGRVNLQKIKSVRIKGDVFYEDGKRNAITVMKKKPNLVRIVLDTGMIRMTQAYDGKVAWFAREQGRKQFIDRMRGSMEKSFIRDAPLESVLVNSWQTDVELSLGEEIEIAEIPCYQIIADFPDGSRTIHCIDKEEFLERRIYQFNEDKKVVAELVPSNFEQFDGILFAMQMVRIKDERIISTIHVTDVETNIGILDQAFSPPGELPGQ